MSFASPLINLVVFAGVCSVLLFRCDLAAASNVINSASAVNASNVVVPDRYCSFFNNRAPRPVPNLKNCTWYRNSSCCLQREIDATFGQVKPLRGASPGCQLWLNYLICYICSPDQNHFYRRERLTVCEEVCDGFLQACGDAVADGKKIKETYSTGISLWRAGEALYIYVCQSAQKSQNCTWLRKNIFPLQKCFQMSHSAIFKSIRNHL